MSLVQKSANPEKTMQTNLADWSALTPLSLEDGPRARELYRAVRRMIESGQAAPGAKLPTTRDIAQRLGVSRASAVAAYETLVAEGFAEATVGAGTFVAPAVPRINPTLADSSAQVMPGSGWAGPLPCALGVAAPDLRSLQAFRRLLSRRLAQPDPSFFHYGDPRGGLELRQAIAGYLRSARGLRCGPDDVLITAGSLHGLDLVARVTIRPGDPVWIEDPCYPMARRALESLGAALVPVAVDHEGIDPDRAVERQARAAYVTPSHQFPLGVAMSMRRRLALIAWAREADAWIVEDDYDSEFRYAGPPLAALQGMDDHGRVAYLGTFAKVLSPGLRVGYAVLPPTLMAAVLDLRTQSDRQPPSLMEGAVADFVNGGHFAAHIRRVRRRVQASRDALVAGLGDSFAVTAPPQGLHLVAGLRAPSAGADFDDESLAQAALRAGVAARPLSPMYLDAAPRQGLVLGFSGFADATLRSAGRTLASLLRSETGEACNQHVAPGPNTRL